MRESATTRVSIADLAAPEPGSSTIGPFGSNLVAHDYRDSGCPVVFVRDIKAGEFHWVSNVYVSEAKARSLRAHAVEGGDLLMTKMGTPPCVAAVYPTDLPAGIITADVIRIRLNGSLVDSRWLSCYVNHKKFASQVRAITGGVTRPKVTLRDVRSLVVDLPALEEQRRIVEILDAADERMDTVSRELQKLRLLELSMRRALIRTVDADEIEVGALGDVVTGSTPPADEVLWGGDLFFVTPAELGSSPYVGRSPRTLTEVARPYVRRLPKGAVLAVCIGFSYGKLGIADVELCTNQQINAIVPRVGVNSTYVYLALAEFIARLKGLSAIQVTPIINKSLFSSIKIPLPAESDQRHIASCMETVWRRISDGSAEIEKLQILKQGLVEDLLIGRVRV